MLFRIAQQDLSLKHTPHNSRVLHRIYGTPFRRAKRNPWPANALRHRVPKCSVQNCLPLGIHTALHLDAYGCGTSNWSQIVRAFIAAREFFCYGKGHIKECLSFVFRGPISPGGLRGHRPSPECEGGQRKGSERVPRRASRKRAGKRGRTRSNLQESRRVTRGKGRKARETVRTVQNERRPPGGQAGGLAVLVEKTRAGMCFSADSKWTSRAPATQSTAIQNLLCAFANSRLTFCCRGTKASSAS